MTVNEAIKYDKGVLLLTDTLLTSGDEDIGPIVKIFKVSNNAALTFSGYLDEGQKIKQHLQTIILRAWKSIDAYITTKEEEAIELIKKDPTQLKLKLPKAESGEKDIEQIIRKMPMESKRALLFPYEEAYLTLRTDSSPTLETTIEKDFDGKKTIPLNTFVVQNIKGSLVFDVESIATYVRQIMGLNNVTKSSFILIGCDLDGPRIINIYSSGATKEVKYFATGGSVYRLVNAYLNEHYKLGIKKEEALQLAVYSALKAAKKDRSINTIFNIVTIDCDENSIQRRYYSDEAVKHIKTVAANLKPQLVPAK